MLQSIRFLPRLAQRPNMARRPAQAFFPPLAQSIHSAANNSDNDDFSDFSTPPRPETVKTTTPTPAGMLQDQQRLRQQLVHEFTGSPSATGHSDAVFDYATSGAGGQAITGTPDDDEFRVVSVSELTGANFYQHYGIVAPEPDADTDDPSMASGKYPINLDLVAGQAPPRRHGYLDRSMGEDIQARAEIFNAFNPLYGYHPAFRQLTPPQPTQNPFDPIINRIVPSPPSDVRHFPSPGQPGYLPEFKTLPQFLDDHPAMRPIRALDSTAAIEGNKFERSDDPPALSGTLYRAFLNTRSFNVDRLAELKQAADPVTAFAHELLLTAQGDSSMDLPKIIDEITTFMLAPRASPLTKRQFFGFVDFLLALVDSAPALLPRVQPCLSRAFTTFANKPKDVRALRAHVDTLALRNEIFALLVASSDTVGAKHLDSLKARGFAVGPLFHLAKTLDDLLNNSICAPLVRAAESLVHVDELDAAAADRASTADGSAGSDLSADEEYMDETPVAAFGPGRGIPQPGFLPRPGSSFFQQKPLPTGPGSADPASLPMHVHLHDLHLARSQSALSAPEQVQRHLTIFETAVAGLLAELGAAAPPTLRVATLDPDRMFQEVLGYTDGLASGAAGTMYIDSQGFLRNIDHHIVLQPGSPVTSLSNPNNAKTVCPTDMADLQGNPVYFDRQSRLRYRDATFYNVAYHNFHQLDNKLTVTPFEPIPFRHDEFGRVLDGSGRPLAESAGGPAAIRHDARGFGFLPDGRLASIPWGPFTGPAGGHILYPEFREDFTGVLATPFRSLRLSLAQHMKDLSAPELFLAPDLRSSANPQPQPFDLGAGLRALAGVLRQARLIRSSDEELGLLPRADLIPAPPGGYSPTALLEAHGVAGPEGTFLPGMLAVSAMPFTPAPELAPTLYTAGNAMIDANGRLLSFNADKRLVDGAGRPMSFNSGGLQVDHQGAVMYGSATDLAFAVAPGRRTITNPRAGGPFVQHSPFGPDGRPIFPASGNSPARDLYGAPLHLDKEGHQVDMSSGRPVRVFYNNAGIRCDPVTGQPMLFANPTTGMTRAQLEAHVEAGESLFLSAPPAELDILRQASNPGAPAVVLHHGSPGSQPIMLSPAGDLATPAGRPALFTKQGLRASTFQPHAPGLFLADGSEVQILDEQDPATLAGDLLTGPLAPFVTGPFAGNAPGQSFFLFQGSIMIDAQGNFLGRSGSRAFLTAGFDLLNEAGQLSASALQDLSPEVCPELGGPVVPPAFDAPREAVRSNPLLFRHVAAAASWAHAQAAGAPGPALHTSSELPSLGRQEGLLRNVFDLLLFEGRQGIPIPTMPLNS
ncbi:hypothetical protein H696_03409 [Fonticula alba]|uniref:Uncharacterized protein n=1 Tax=Fonticula alba TaxID=691883 RepID=A0A058Z6P8_FONAL|nr:hypothetical protein H696_03409 [Fonticula alba]KCV69944.1 hypothetical protein H696_03409 [Fonticula alba]|eukprot:XP_009495550.1 hypothetical protein H696_03409 [Fonticula alba]